MSGEVCGSSALAVPAFSFIVVSYASPDLLERCIASIERTSAPEQAGFRYEVIVVAVPDGTTRREINGPTVVTLERNSGFAAACNRGASVAKGGILIFLNADVEIMQLPWTQLLEAFTGDNKLGLIAPMIVEGGRAVNSIRTFPTVARDAAAELGLNASPEEVASGPFFGWAGGMALFVRAAAYRVIGGFDDRFFLYYEDTDLGQRMENAGYRQLYLPAIRVQHASGGSSGGLLWRKTALRYESKLHYMGKHLDRWSFAMHTVITLAILFAKTLLGILRHRGPRSVNAYVYAAKLYVRLGIPSLLSPGPKACRVQALARYRRETLDL